MSYCRFSSDDWKCDICAYESDMGYEIHVAARRIVGDVPTLPDPLAVSGQEWSAAYVAQLAFIKTARREQITLLHAGESFTCSDLGSFEARLRVLREIGYNVPDYVFEEIAQERAVEEKDITHESN